MRSIILKLSKNITTVIILIVLLQSCSKPDNYYESKLKEFESLVNLEKDKYWSILEKYSKEYIISNRDSSSLHHIVYNCLKSDKNIKVVTYVSSEGQIIETLPDKYSKFKGKNISKQPHVQYIQKYKTKFISRKFMAVQGFEAMSFINPILDDGKYLGTLNILLEPNKIIKNALQKIQFPEFSRVMIIQGDGVVLYSDLAHFNNSNIITFENYNDNLAENLIKTIGRRRTGELSFFYDFEGKKIKFFWKQIPMEKDKWAIVIINPI